MQIENEYGAFGYDDFPRDTAYLESLKDALGQFGIESLLFTSDSPKGTQDFGSIPGGTYGPNCFLEHFNINFAFQYF